MKKIKDFLYDKNDILIALLILVAAAFLILWRMEVIMAYPQTVFSSGDDSSVQLEDGDAADSQSGDGENADGDQNTGDDNQTGDGDNQGADALFADGMLTRDVEVNVTGTSATAAVNCLVDAGLFEDYAEYQQICADTGLNHEKVSAGTMLFEKGSTKKDIARKINWS
ncbi:MAG: hypothetical protein ACI4LJ_07915 [Anaerovoracaceae bacterium]